MMLFTIFTKKTLFALLSCLLITQTLTACKPNAKADSLPVGTAQSSEQNLSPISQNSTSENKSCNNQAIYKAFIQKKENQKIQVLGCGQVKKVLKDDNDGSRHQKFLMTIDGYPQMTVLIAHNIDLAQRVSDIQVNAPIRFYGEYIYNDKGGVLHWTHKDPTARHQDGWLEYEGKKYW